MLLSQVCGEYQQRLEDQVLEPVLALCQPAAGGHGRRAAAVAGAGQPDEQHLQIRHARHPGVSHHREGGGHRPAWSVRNISRYPLNISADELTERFVRGDSSRSTEGSGLGLSIATSLMSLQGGDFRLTIDGDLFKVTLILPRAEQEEKQE